MKRLTQTKRIDAAVKKALSRKPSDIISKMDKDFLRGQVKARVRIQPEKLIPRVRQRTLQLLKRPVPVKEKIVKITLKDMAVPKIRQLALKRLGFKIKVKPKAPRQVAKTFTRQIQSQVSKSIRQAQRQITKSILIPKQPTRIFAPIIFSRQIAAQELKSIQRQAQRPVQISREDISPVITASTPTVPRSIQEIIQVPVQITPPVERFVPRFKEEILPEEILADLPKLRARVKKIPAKKVTGYVPEGKSRGKWLRLSKLPLGKESAKDRGAFAIDNSTATTFRVRQVKAKKLGAVKRRGYFGSVRQKFRDYKIVKGKRVKLKDKYIERKGKPRIDTLGEKEGLKLARLIKKQRFID